MSTLAMPMIIVNLGCEMLYVLEQRLKAQTIPHDKSVKVLKDVVTSMFDKHFLDKLFTPQELYSVASVRKIFDKLAHSSIMRLSESSMDKLFDLMVMGFKYQLVCSTRLEQMLEVSRLHLATIQQILTSMGDASMGDSVAYVDSLMVRTYGGLAMGQLHLLRQSLMKFFQDRRVKVSLFLQEGIQTPVGRLVLPSPNAQHVGTVTLYDTRGGIAGQVRIPLRSQEVDPREFFTHPVPFGANLYNKDRPKVMPPPRKGDAAVAPTEDDAPQRASGPGAYAEDLLEKGGRGARSELDLLGALLSGVKAPQAADNFKLALFGEDDPGYATSASKVINLNFGGGRNDAHLAGVMKEMTLDDRGAGADDLLDLMDNAR